MILLLSIIQLIICNVIVVDSRYYEYKRPRYEDGPTLDDELAN